MGNRSTSASIKCSPGKLDDASGPEIADLDLEGYLSKLGPAFDEANSWNVVRSTQNGCKVSWGKYKDKDVISMFWVQEIEESSAQTGKMLQAIKELIMDTTGKYSEWDKTFLGQSVLGKWPGDFCGESALVLRKFTAGPLANRDMLYFLACKEEICNGDRSYLYGYPSVHNSWVKSQISVDAPVTGFVRSLNIFPSADRVTVLNDGMRLRVEHLMTTDIRGWVPNCIFNSAFRGALVDTYSTEAELFREHVHSLAAKM